MVRVIITTNKQELDRLMRSPQGPAVAFMQRVLDDADTRSKDWLSRLAERRSGNLMNSHIRTPIAISGKKITAGIENTASYAMYVHEGTRPHVIRPRRAQVLYFVSPGRGAYPPGPVFAKQVHHPGTKPRPWLRMAAREVSRKHGLVFTEK